MTEHQIEIRVRYPEVDSMGFLHHSRHLQYFEMGRTELLRSLGFTYADLEERGFLFVVVKVEVKYRAPAKYDDVLTLITRVTRQTLVRFDHSYELRRGDQLIADGLSTIACVNRQGEVVEMPEELKPE